MKIIEDLGQILVVLHLLSDCPASERELRLSIRRFGDAVSGGSVHQITGFGMNHL